VDLESADLGTVLVDPPRAGLDGATVELLRRFDHVIYVSCNPGKKGEGSGAIRRAGRSGLRSCTPPQALGARDSKRTRQACREACLARTGL
jgi:hypothetical protein